MRLGVGIDLRHGPVGEHADFLHLPAGGGPVVFDLAQVGAGRRLLAAQTREPPVEGLEVTHQRLDLADLAALGWLDYIEEAVLRFMLRKRGKRQSVDQIQPPLGGHPIAIGEQFLEVISGF